VPPTRNKVQRLGGWLLKMLGKDEEERELVSITTDFKGDKRDDYQYLEIKQQNLDIGEYLLSLTVRDLTNGGQATKDQRFWIGPDEVGLVNREE